MEEIVKKIYDLALLEHPEFMEIRATDIIEVIQSAVIQINKFEEVAKHAPKINDKISALWIFSGAGTYHGLISGERYSKYEWAKNMDRERVNHAVKILRTSIEDFKNYPMIIYNGGDNQNIAIKEAINNKEIDILEEEIMIIGSGIKNTLDQIQTFVFPENLHKPHREIGLITHAPQLPRILHMLNYYKVLPMDMTVRLLPMSTPPDGKEEYMVMEVKGLLYYVFLGGNALVTPYPYKV